MMTSWRFVAQLNRSSAGVSFTDIAEHRLWSQEAPVPHIPEHYPCAKAGCRPAIMLEYLCNIAAVRGDCCLGLIVGTAQDAIQDRPHSFLDRREQDQTGADSNHNRTDAATSAAPTEGTLRKIAAWSGLPSASLS